MHGFMASSALLLALVPVAFAVSMTHYEAGSGVDAAFKDFVEECVPNDKYLAWRKY